VPSLGDGSFPGVATAQAVKGESVASRFVEAIPRGQLARDPRADVRHVRAPSGSRRDAKKHPPRARQAGPAVCRLVEFTGKDLRVAKIKAHSLTGRITETLMVTAFRNVKRNRGAAGIDRIASRCSRTTSYRTCWPLCARLKDGTFRPCPCAGCISQGGRKDTSARHPSCPRSRGSRGAQVTSEPAL